jgi:hypothetical protein
VKKIPDEQEEIVRIIHEYTKCKSNVYSAERIFMAHSAIKWAYKNAANEQVLRLYLSEIEKHLKNEITLYWHKGTIRIDNGLERFD